MGENNAVGDLTTGSVDSFLRDPAPERVIDIAIPNIRVIRRREPDRLGAGGVVETVDERLFPDAFRGCGDNPSGIIIGVGSTTNSNGLRTGKIDPGICLPGGGKTVEYTCRAETKGFLLPQLLSSTR